jgi:hypothetical protein
MEKSTYEIIKGYSKKIIKNRLYEPGAYWRTMKSGV